MSTINIVKKNVSVFTGKLFSYFLKKKYHVVSIEHPKNLFINIITILNLNRDIQGERGIWDCKLHWYPKFYNKGWP